jgi:uncharacterized membrane protein
MEYSRHRFEFFSDGFMAIVMTIMVLEIYVSKSISIEGVEELLKSILIYFISFFIVGWFLTRHHHLIDNTQKITSKIIWKNLVFLFFVALVPIFTKLIIENNANNMTIIAYDIVFLLANLSFQILRHESWNQIEKEEREKIHAERLKNHKYLTLRIVIGCIILLGLVVLTIFFPKLSLIMFIVFPIIFALMNIFFDFDVRRHINYKNM